MIYFFVFLSLLFSIVALVMPTLDEPLSFESSDVLNLLGVTITGVAFIIGCYFAFKAIEAYRHVRELEKQLKEINDLKNKLSKDVENISKNRDEVFSNIVDTADLIFESINDILLTTAKSETLDKDNETKKEIGNAIDQISHFRGKLFYIKNVPDKDRDTYLQFLVNRGDELDLEKLKKIIADPTESEDIRNHAKRAYGMIQNRLKEEQKSKNSPYG